MEQYLPKATVIAEIEKRYEYWREKEFNSHSIESEIRMSECQHLMLLFNSIEVKEVDLEKEIDSTYRNYVAFGRQEIAAVAKHFFELGLKAQYSSISIPNIDDIFEEEGIDPNSKDAKIFKECYYMALEKLKEQKL